MYRNIMEDLLEWKKDSSMPLMLIGARQTGKTYILKQFCEEYFNNYIYINLEKDKEFKEIFENTIIPEEIISHIEILLKKKIDIENTIIFIDEIQESEKAITSLKYFCESELNYKIVCAGSLLGVKINRSSSSFPVGKVIIKYLYPMNFYEFLLALKEDLLIDEIKKHYENNTALPNNIHNKALDLYNKYLIIGGMPAVINDYISKDFQINELNYDLQQYIIYSYLADMNKYTENSESIKINQIYTSIPKELARENNSFKFSLIDKNARKIRYESSIDWLLASNLVFKCNLAEKNISPLKAYINSDKFKLYLSDVGLLRSLSNIEYNEILLDKNDMYKGVLAENRFANYEIDFLIKINGDIIPVEVKARNKTTSKSLNEYIKKYNPSYSIRISTKNFGFENNIKSIPLYALFCLNSKSINK